MPGDIVAGPDGAMYTADSSLGKVLRISDAGKVRSYDVGGGATGIASAHGSLWVSERDGSQIIKLGLDGSKTAYPLAPGAFPTDIVLGSDGALWFNELRGNAIGRLTKDGQLTEYPLPTPDAFLADITAGPDGALWFTESSGNKVGRITTAGEITEYALPGAESMPSGITAGPDGALWFTELNGNKIGRMTTAGVLTHEHPIPVENATPISIVAGPDGAIYYTQHSDGSVARMALDGTVTKRYRLPSGSPDGLGVGPDGDLWFTQGNFGQVGRDRPALGPADHRFRHDVRDEALRVRGADGGDVHRRRSRGPLRRHDQVGRRHDVGRLGAAYRQRLRGPRPARLRQGQVLHRHGQDREDQGREHGGRQPLTLTRSMTNSSVSFGATAGGVPMLAVAEARAAR